MIECETASPGFSWDRFMTDSEQMKFLKLLAAIPAIGFLFFLTIAIYGRLAATKAVDAAKTVAAAAATASSATVDAATNAAAGAAALATTAVPTTGNERRLIDLGRHSLGMNAKEFAVEVDRAKREHINNGRVLPAFTKKDFEDFPLVEGDQGERSIQPE